MREAVMKLKKGDEVRTPHGRGFIRNVAYDTKFDVTVYFVDVMKTDRMARITKTKYDTMKFWDYEVRGIK